MSKKLLGTAEMSQKRPVNNDYELKIGYFFFNWIKFDTYRQKLNGKVNKGIYKFSFMTSSQHW